jgi:hypothetical protein
MAPSLHHNRYRRYPCTGFAYGQGQKLLTPHLFSCKALRFRRGNACGIFFLKNNKNSSSQVYTLGYCKNNKRVGIDNVQRTFIP